MIYDGAAGVYSADGFLAECGEITFALSEDYNTIYISVLENTDWSHLSGQYKRVGTGDATTYGNMYGSRIEVVFDGL